VDNEIRPASADDYDELLRLDGFAFGEHYTEQDAEDAFGTEPATYLVAIADGQVIGVAGHFDFTMTVPGGAIPVPGVTWVSVSPLHRRRGVLRALMDRQLRGFADQGFAAAILIASEGSIYGRFGYGPASSVRHTVLDRRFTRLAPSERKTSGEVRLLTAEQARTVLPDLHRRWHEQVPGALNRTEAWWDHLFLDREQHRGGMSAKFYLAHPDGYVTYRVKEQWNEGIAALQCRILDYVALSPDAHAALWQVLLGMDLIETIESHQIAADDPLPFLVTDFRQVRTTAVNDGVWVRPLDPAALLAARSYQVEIDTVVEVRDPLLGDRRVALAGGPDGARCEPTDRPAQVSFSLAGLGSAYLGGHRLSTLVRAGAVGCDDPALLSRLGLAFATDRAPLHGTAF
jgi:predicted acetyltransferase